MSNNDQFFPAVMLLKDASPLIYNLLKSLVDNHEISNQLDNVWVPMQVITGSECSFSFMAYPLPRLTIEERKSTELIGSDSLFLGGDDLIIRIDVDDYGKINWFYINGMPDAFREITFSLRSRRCD